VATEASINVFDAIGWGPRFVWDERPSLGVPPVGTSAGERVADRALADLASEDAIVRSAQLGV
jgi:hypothetical protein